MIVSKQTSCWLPYDFNHCSSIKVISTILGTWKMASSSNAQQVMGHAFTRPKVSQFNSSFQSFSKYQNELQNSFVSGHPNPMDPKRSAGMFNELLKSIDTADKALVALLRSRDAVELETAKADVVSLKATLLSWEKDDLTFLSILQHSLGGPAYLVAFPPVPTFKLKEKPELWLI